MMWRVLLATILMLYWTLTGKLHHRSYGKEDE